MTVYVDPAIWPWRGRVWAHLTADTTEELHEFAGRLGLKRSWFQQGRQPWLDHYDVTDRMREKAIGLGAVAQTVHEAGRRTIARARTEAPR
jgi:hypothetical protein